MSRPIDEKIAKLTLDNSDLKDKAIESTQIFATLSKDIANSADLGAMSDNIEQIANKFSTTGIMFQEVIRRMTNSAIDGFKGLVGKALDPILELGSRRALNIEQAKFQFEGLGMDIEASMDSANRAVLGTAFGLDEAAVVAANFGATGMRAGDEMYGALRAVAGVAAMSGSTFSDVGNIFSKVAGQGRLMGSDLLRLSSRGINAAATLGNQMGITEAQVRELVTKGKISFEMFADAMNQAFGEHATKANETYTGSLSNMRAAFGRIGAVFYTSKYENRKNLFNSLTPQINKFNEAITPAIRAWNDFAKARNNNLISFIDSINFDPFLEGGGQFMISRGLSNIFNNILDITKAIKNAWSNVFGGDNQNESFLLRLANGFERLTEKITLGDVGLQRLENTFGIFFTVLSWVTDGVKLLFRGLGLLIPSFDLSRDSAEGAVGGISNMVYAFDDWLRTSPKVRKALEWIADGLVQLSEWIVIGAEKAWEGLKWLGDAIVDAYIFVEPYIIEFAKAVQAWIIDKWIEWKPTLQEFAETLKDWAIVIWETAKDLGEKAGPLLQRFWETASGFFGELDWGKTLKIGAILAALWYIHEIYWKIVVWRRQFKKGEEVSIFASLNRGVAALINIAKAATIMAIAGALAVLATSIWVFGKMDVESIVNGMVALGTAMFFLSSTFKIIAEASKNMKAFSSIATLGAMMTSLIIMTGVIYTLSRMEWANLAKGLIGVAGSLLALSVAVKTMGSVNGKIGVSAIQLLALSTSLIIMTIPLQTMAAMPWDKLGRGLFGIGAALAAIAMFNVASTGGWAHTGTAVAVGLLAVSLLALSIPIKIFSMIKLETLAKGLGAMAVALAVTGIALYSLPLHAGANAVALATVAAAMLLLTVPLKILGQMELKEIGVGLLAIAGVLTTFTAAVYLIGPAGAAILASVAAALAALGTASIGTALLIGVLVVAFIGLADTTGSVVEKMVDNFATFLNSIKKIIPTIVDVIVSGLGAILRGIQDLAGVVAETIAIVLATVLDVLAKYAPRFIDAAGRLMLAIVEGLEKYTPPIVVATINLIITVLNSMANAISNNAEPIFAAIGRLFGAILILVVEGLNSIFQAIFDWTGLLAEPLDNFTNAIVEGLRGKFDIVGETGEQYVEEFTDPMTGRAGRGRGNMAGKALKESVVEGAKDDEGMFSGLSFDAIGDYSMPFSDFDGFDLGFDMPDGVMDGINQNDFSLLSEEQLEEYGLNFEEFDGTDLGFNVGQSTHSGMQNFFAEYPLEGLSDEELDAYIDSFKDHNEEVRQEAEREARYSYDGMDQFFNEYPLEGIAEDEIDDYIQTFRDHNEKVRAQGEETARETEKGVDSVDFTPAGQRNMNEYETGVRLENPNVRRTTKKVAEDARNEANKVDYTPTGRSKAAELAGGISVGRGRVENAGRLAAQAGRSGARGVDFTATGRSLSQGLANGISGSAWLVRNAGSSAAAQAVTAARGIFRTASPSRVFFEMGQFVSQGLALGIKKDENLVGSSSRHMALEAINAVENAAKDFNSKIFDEMNLQPTITPVLDLSNLRDQDILEGLGDSRTRRLAGLFNQTNNRNLEGSKSQQAGDNVVNEYHAHITAYGNMPDSMIRGMANKMQQEFQRMADRKEINRGGVYA